MAGMLAHNATVPLGPVTAAAIAWHFQGVLSVTAIVKATFAFAPNAAMSRVEPQEIFAGDVHHGNSPARSVRFTTDLVPSRPRADILFTGHAYAPSGGGPVASLNVRLAVLRDGRPLLDKSLLVKKDAGWTKIALTFENAFGGIGHPDNPYGDGFDDDDERPPAVLDPVDPRRVACFAPLPEGLPARKRLLGASPIPKLGLHPATLPGDLNWEFFQAAPADQRIDAVRGDEEIVLVGLTPGAASVHTSLPAARCLARIHGLSGFGIAEGEPLAMRADTLHISGDEQRCTVTWRGSFRVAGEQALGAVRIAAGVELPGAPIAWPAAEQLARMAGSAAPSPAAARAAAATNVTMMLSDDEIEIVSEDAQSPGRMAKTMVLPEQPAAATMCLQNQTLAPVTPVTATLPFAAAPAGGTLAFSPAAGSQSQSPAAGGPSRSGATLPLPGSELLTAPFPEAPPPVVEAPPPVVKAPPPVVEAPPVVEVPAVAAAAVFAVPDNPPAPVKPPPRPVRPPRKIDIRAKLYGTSSKGR